MTVGELRRVMEPLTDEAEVLFPSFENPGYGSYKRAERATVEVVKPVEDTGFIVRAKEGEGQIQAALVIR